MTLPPKDLSIQVINGQTRVAFDNEIGNDHTGPLAVFPEKIPASGDTDDCNGDGIATNDRKAYQRVYQDKNNDGVFKRGIDNKRSEIFPAGCMVFHPAHDHWHFDLAKYELTELDGTGVASSGKVSFCIADVWHFNPDLPGSPNAPFYNRCNRNSTQGLSIGWSDEYPSTVAGQYIVINGVADGDYCLVSTADPAYPDHPNGNLVEADNSNNSAAIKIRLADSGSTVTVLSSSGCP